MQKAKARCPYCNNLLHEREMFCRNCQRAVERKDKEHELTGDQQ